MPASESTNAPRHFLVVAASSRCARFFIAKALETGNKVTALCRAQDDASALARMKDLLHPLMEHIGSEPDFSGLCAASRSILESRTYQDRLAQDPSIDAIACFVGPSKIREMLNPLNTIYTQTITAILEGVARSRPVEVLYHSSVGVGGQPRLAENYWPANFPALSPVVHHLLPVFQNLRDSERLFESEAFGHQDYIVFRPATLKDEAAVGGTLSLSDLGKQKPYRAELKSAETVINREDVAHEMLRVAMYEQAERQSLYRTSLYLTRTTKPKS